MRYLDAIGRWFRLLFEPKKHYGFSVVEDPPDELDDNVVYLIADGGPPWSATFVCPCGCKERISLSLIPRDRPNWRATVNNDGITLHPSVWRKKDCRSHFFIRGGRVLWARELH
jgi:hypothetical protein